MTDSSSEAAGIGPETTVEGYLDSGGGASRYERDLDDAIYYLRHDCLPCAERHFDRARRHGASEAEVETARARGLSPL